MISVNQTCVCKYNQNTLNTPYKAGLTGSSLGLVFVNYTAGSNYVNYLVMPAGDINYYKATSNNGVLNGSWTRISDGGNADTLQGYNYSQIMNEVAKYRTEIVIRAYDTPYNTKGYYHADYVCSSTNARTVIQQAVDNAPAGSTIPQ